MSVELLGAGLQPRKSGSLPWLINPSPTCGPHPIAIMQGGSEPSLAWLEFTQRHDQPFEGLKGWISDGLQNCYAEASFASVGLVPGTTLPGFFFASFHSEL